MSVSSRARRDRARTGARGKRRKRARVGVLERLSGAPPRARRRLGRATHAMGGVLSALGRRRVAAVLLAAAVLGATWLWLRDSSLVAVRQVVITGVTGPDSGRIRAVLIAAGRTMTTLDVQRSRLETAVAPYPEVKGLLVRTDFPHGLRIHVIEEVPSAILTAGGGRVLVAADGTVLRVASANRALPLVPVPALPVGPRVTGRDVRQELAVVAGAPTAMRTRVAGVLHTAAHGIVVELRAGPSLYFGSAVSVHAKWIAAAAVLGNPGSAGAAYIDLSDPSRPAAG